MPVLEGKIDESILVSGVNRFTINWWVFANHRLFVLAACKNGNEGHKEGEHNK